MGRPFGPAWAPRNAQRANVGPAGFSTATVMFGATVSTPLPLLLEVPLRLRLGLRLVPRYRYCLEFRALRLGSLLGLGLPATAKARPRAIYIIAVLPIIEYRT